MPIVKQTIKAELIQLINDTKELDQQKAQEKFADSLADIIINALKSAVVSVNVTTTGTAATQSGVGTGSLS